MYRLVLDIAISCLLNKCYNAWTNNFCLTEPPLRDEQSVKVAGNQRRLRKSSRRMSRKSEGVDERPMDPGLKLGTTWMQKKKVCFCTKQKFPYSYLIR